MRSLWLLSAPGFLIRLNDVSGAMPLNIDKATVVLCTHPSFLIMLIMAVVLISGKRTDILRNKLVILLMVSAICSVCIHLNSTRSPRSGWWGEFCSILLVVYFLDRLLSPVWKRCRNGKALWYVVPISVLIVIHMVVVDYYSVRIGRTFDGAVDAYRKDRCRTVYADFITEYDAPLISMLAPDFTLFSSLYNIHFVNMYFGTVGDECEFRVIPSEFRELTAESGEPVDGDMGVRRIGNHLFAPVDFLSNREITATADFGFGPRRVRIFCYPFVSDKDGRRYAYLYLWRSVTDMRAGELRSINK